MLSQACEQLNAWLAGYQTIMNRMSFETFQWFLHVLLFLHARTVEGRILCKEEKKGATVGEDQDDDEDPEITAFGDLD